MGDIWLIINKLRKYKFEMGIRMGIN